MTRARDVANIDGILTTTGDTFYASAAATPARLGIGSTGNVLTVAGGVPSWAAPAGGAAAVAQIATGTLSGVSVSLTGFTQDFIVIQIISPNWGTGADSMIMNINSNTTGVYDYNVLCQDAGTSNTRNSAVNDTKADFTFYSVDRTASSIHYIY
jgi:hypothetical protein